MSIVATENTNIKRLAFALEDDIRRRGLRPGDRYLTAVEAGKQFKASKMSVHRAMQYLAEEDFLVRQRGAGTFVGSKFEVTPERWCPLEIVHVVMSMDYQRIATFPAELLVEHLGITMPQAVIEVNYVSSFESQRHLDRLVGRIAEENKSKEGLILIRSTRPMQQLIEESGLPAVVFGSVYSDVTKLSSVDVDQFEIGRLMARHALDERCERLVLLMRDDWRHGDNAMLAGITQELCAGGLGFDALTICCLSPERDHIVEEVRRIKSEHEETDAFLCRNHVYADAADEALQALAKRDSVQIISGGGRKPIKARYPYVAPDVDEDGQIQLLGNMLVDQATQEKTQVENQVIPVHLCKP
ncbi:GntR family transcriptional regulator [Adhaeretor mobilis]|uniref:Transcriptional regulator PdhR n=1 Tax=Adhaeretor mobilis TaxID=1930276 RepID=A0A517MW23_9BACT|nr:GntR family transcriptional regulator [Adhaeretor mobilis]QDS99081.1 transcriptional regulator PdhR [Adhaeretor mobilis]